ncbi:outer membrane beta-barrel protein [Methylocystis sp.]|uniref:outer membrane protein n=1 Tax=Methylocystis sp. TaxID=1911079 RepID=UPI0025E064B8|nr:outer membrane beta-barrel protein [Methylocystis sp.]
MKKSLSAVALALALTGPALAADLPHYKAPPPPPPPPPPMWTGFYVGLNAGGGWASSTNTRITSAPIYNPAGFNPDIVLRAALSGSALIGGNNNGGFLGGGQIGYNWQFYNGAVVAGVEADIQGIASNNSSRTAWNAVVTLNGDPLSTVYNVSNRLDYIGTVRGRLGWLFTPTFLLYGTGGLAYGGVQSSVSMLQFRDVGLGSQLFGLTSGAFSDTRVGWTVGGGVEWMFWPNWSAKVEYLYYDLGNVNYAAGVLVGSNFGFSRYGIAPQINNRYNGNIVRAGVNYHFNWGAAPVVAKY